MKEYSNWLRIITSPIIQNLNEYYSKEGKT
jgi:hypothetical protein